MRVTSDGAADDERVQVRRAASAAMTTGERDGAEETTMMTIPSEAVAAVAEAVLDVMEEARSIQVRPVEHSRVVLRPIDHKEEEHRLVFSKEVSRTSSV